MQADDFTDFHREIHGWRPFPWQRDLVDEVLEHGSWPSLVDVPTGLGKTTMLDIAVFFSALTADIKDNTRIGRRRIFFVVDRRIVVDQAASHASRIAQGLESARPGSVAAQVAAGLRKLVSPSAPSTLLPVVKMRGGVTWDSAWLTRPDQPGIITGTVDQVGSRLFFRGYGVSPRRWPIDAALVGTDSVIFVDEAHLATALTTTLGAAESYDSPRASLGIPQAAVVQLTATARDQPTGWTPKFDTQAHLANAEARQRLTATKTLVVETAAEDSAVQKLAEAALAKSTDAGSRLLVVCNTIDRARAVHAQLTKRLPEPAQLLLLIGRTRQYDREAIVAQALGLFAAGRTEDRGSAVLVATQTVEVGIDLDATDLVTESASWDALVQRIGRVNRRGLRSSASVTVIHTDNPNAPVYGTASAHAAEFLQDLIRANHGPIDVSPLALRGFSPPRDALLDPPTIPLLLPPHLDAWTRTGPAPANDAPLDPYLHGIDNGVAPVSLAWRDGLLNGDGSAAGQGEATQAIDSIPVRAEECVEVPLSAVRRWLVGVKSEPVSDWDDDDDWEAPPFGHTSMDSVLRRVTEIDGSAAWRWASAAQLRPGDLVVVPTEMGGLDQYGWSPTSKQRVTDIAELAALERNQPALRLDLRLPNRLALTSPNPELWEGIQAWQTTDDPEIRLELEQRCKGWLLAWLDEAQPLTESAWDRENRRQRLRQIMENATVHPVPESVNRRDAVEQRFLLPVALMRPAGSTVRWQEASDDATDGTVHLNRRVTLAKHCQAVADRAREIVEHLGLSDDLAQAVYDAARWHDLGKADPRFQAMLLDGDPVRAAIAVEPLAKSGMPPGDLQRQREARRRSGLPRRARHETWSVALITQYLMTLADGYSADADLVLHLIASHHGYSRPLLPIVTDNANHQLSVYADGIEMTAELPRAVDLGHADAFHLLNRRYGRWGLALLEAVVRCADMTVSGEGS